MKITPDNEKLLDLIQDARKGKLVLPQFQRNFVWSRDDITELLLSILQGHFIGSFLFLEVDKDNVPFAYRLLQGVNVLANYKPEQMILDGQQRLTSLHYVFAAPEIPLRWTKYPYRFFLNLDAVAIGDLEESIRSERSQDCRELLDEIYQYEHRIIPMTTLESWNEWLNNYERYWVERDPQFYLNHYFKILKPKWNDAVSKISDFLVPTLTIPKISPEDNKGGLAEICAIFEKINSMGVKLSVYDLLTARLYKDGIDLHELWLKSVDDYHLLDEYSEGKPDEFGVYVLRTIALLRGLDVKSKTLINISPKDFETDWILAVKYMEKALERMTAVNDDGFGAFNRKWLPYITMISPLAALLARINDLKLDHNIYKLIRSWYWSSIFRERYAGAVESMIYRDYQDLLKASKDGNFEPEAIRDARQNIVENKAFSLRDIIRLNSLYRGVMCLIALRGAKDFCADDSIQFHILEDHHIFPYAFLKNQKGKPYKLDVINCVINRTLIADVTNRKISGKKPSEYVNNLIPAESRDKILKSHFINAEALEMMQHDDYDAFLDYREKALIAEIRRRIVEMHKENPHVL